MVIPTVSGRVAFGTSKRMRMKRGGRALSKRQRTAVKRIIGAETELKYYYVTNISQTITFSGGIFSMCDVPQGDSDSSRDGDRLNLKSLDLRFDCQNANPSTSGHWNNLRIILFQWRPNTVPTVSSILQTTGSSLAPLSQYVHDDRQEYKILWDKCVTTLGDSQSAVFNRHVVLYKNFARNIQFVAGGLVATNKIYLLTISDDGATAFPAIDYVCKITYTDA